MNPLDQQPSEPGVPPVIPVQPAQPMQPVMPVQSIQPEMPTPSVMPVQPAQPTQPAVNPGHGLGVAALILAFFISPLGIILGIVGLLKSKKAGFKNGLALAGIIIGALSLIGTILLVSSATTAVVNTSNDLIDGVNNGTCTFTINGVVQDC